jgi:predicted TIM-barrel fold metal-dependent hydrolase
VENGSEYLRDMFKKIRSMVKKQPGWFADHDPIETFREHVWVAPFYEDDLSKLKDLIGVDRIVMGSDWPHAEGLYDPKTFADDLKRNDYTDDEIKTIMVENGWTLPYRRVPATV